MRQSTNLSSPSPATSSCAALATQRSRTKKNNSDDGAGDRDVLLELAVSRSARPRNSLLNALRGVGAAANGGHAAQGPGGQPATLVDLPEPILLIIQDKLEREVRWALDAAWASRLSAGAQEAMRGRAARALGLYSGPSEAGTWRHHLRRLADGFDDIMLAAIRCRRQDPYTALKWRPMGSPRFRRAVELLREYSSAVGPEEKRRTVRLHREDPGPASGSDVAQPRVISDSDLVARWPDLVQTENWSLYKNLRGLDALAMLRPDGAIARLMSSRWSLADVWSYQPNHQRGLVIAAVTRDGRSLAAAPEFIDDLEIVRIAVGQKPSSLAHAGERARDAEDIVATAVAQDGFLLSHASGRLRDTVSVAAAAVLENPKALQYASLRLQADEGFLRQIRGAAPGASPQPVGTEDRGVSLDRSAGEPLSSGVGRRSSAPWDEPRAENLSSKEEAKQRRSERADILRNTRRRVQRARDVPL